MLGVLREYAICSAVSKLLKEITIFLILRENFIENLLYFQCLIYIVVPVLDIVGLTNHEFSSWKKFYRESNFIFYVVQESFL